MRKDTIAAISTAMTNSGIGIVRMSGVESLEIIQKIYKGKVEKNFENIKTHTIHYGYIVDGNETIDEVLVMILKGPHSLLVKILLKSTATVVCMLLKEF